MSRYSKLIFVFLLWSVGIIFSIWGVGTQVTLEIGAEDPLKIQQSLKIYYKSDIDSFSEELSYSRPYVRSVSSGVVQYKFLLPNDTSMMRVDLESLSSPTLIKNLSVYVFKQPINASLISTHSIITTDKGFIVGIDDPQFIFSIKEAQNIKSHQVFLSVVLLTLICGLIGFTQKNNFSTSHNIAFELSKNDTNFIKGVAIFLVLSHNFFHVIPPFPGENEMNFLASRFWWNLAVFGTGAISDWDSTKITHWDS